MEECGPDNHFCAPYISITEFFGSEIGSRALHLLLPVTVVKASVAVGLCKDGLNMTFTTILECQRMEREGS